MLHHKRLTHLISRTQKLFKFNPLAIRKYATTSTQQTAVADSHPTKDASVEKGAQKHNEHHDHHHGPIYTDNDGRIFGWPKLKKGQKRKKEWWERPFIYLFWGGVTLLFVGWILRPDYTIKGWARRESLMREEKRKEYQKNLNEDEELEKVLLQLAVRNLLENEKQQQ